MLEPKRISNFRVSVIVPCYNSKELVRRNLPKVLEAREYKNNQINEIIFVDDASSDNSSYLVEKKFPKVKIIRHKTNRGFSAAVNTGVRAAKGNLLAILHIDAIPEKDFLVSALKRFGNPKVFAVSLHEPGSSWTRGHFKDGLIIFDQSDTDKKLHETFSVSSGGAIYRRDYWMALGGLDEKLLGPSYFEDVDLSYRAAKRGLLNLWDPESMVTHKHDSVARKLTSARVERIRARNRLLFVWKNISSPILFRKHIMGLVQRVISHPGYFRIILMALMRLKIVIKARSKEIKESKLSDEAVFAKFTNG